MKRLIKTLFQKFVGKPIFTIIRKFYTPTERSLQKFAFIGKFRVRTHSGKAFYLYNNAFNLENSIFWLGLETFSWEITTRDIWTHLCKSSDVVFDIGANSGIFAVLAKVYNSDSKVFAFEPQPNIFQVLKKNNGINNFDIKCENIALSNQEGKLPFYNYGTNTFDSNTTAGSLNKEWRTENQESIMVDVRTLANYIENNFINKIDLIKIDVETFEYEVLLGYEKYLSKHQPIIILEIQSPDIGENIETLFDKNNYLYFKIKEGIGLIKLSKLGESQKNVNYLLCPLKKEHLISTFLSSKE